MIVNNSQFSSSIEFDHDPLRQVLARLTKSAVVPQARSELNKSRQDLGIALRDSVLSEVPAYLQSHNPAILPGLQQHASDHIEEICRLFGGGTVGDFEFISVHARLRAEQRFPLEATLHAYRCGQKVFSRWLRDAATAVVSTNRDQVVSAVADFAIEYTNSISSIATSEYVAYTRSMAQAEGDLRTELLGILLSGYDESDGRAARLLRQAGYLEQRQSYCVIVAQSANAVEMESHERARRMVSAITEQMASAQIRMLAGVRNNLVNAVISTGRRQSGWTPEQKRSLADRIQPLLLALGPAVLIGVSADHPSTSFVPRALHEATMALDFASVSNRVVQFSSLPIRSLLVHRGADYVRSATPRWVDELVSADSKADGLLIATLRAVADADMNVQKAARALEKHPNTVYSRLERIKELTGLDGQCYRDLTEMLLAADCWRR